MDIARFPPKAILDIVRSHNVKEDVMDAALAALVNWLPEEEFAALCREIGMHNWR